jgi:hypothetical protein
MQTAANRAAQKNCLIMTDLPLLRSMKGNGIVDRPPAPAVSLGNGSAFETQLRRKFYM